MKVKMVIGKTVYHIFSVYAPQIGRSEDEKAEFWEGLEDKVVGVPRSEGLIVAGDLNSHIGSNQDRYEDAILVLEVRTRRVVWCRIFAKTISCRS